MSLEDKLREGLSAATREDVDTQAMWRRVEQGVAARRRHRPIAWMGGTIAALGLFAGVFLWTIHQFSKEGPSAQRRLAPIVVAGVQWIGDSQVGWKVIPHLTNRTDRPLGAAITCTLLDGRGHRSLPATGVLQLLPPHATTDSYFVFVRSFPAAPVSGHCVARAVPPICPSPLPVVAPRFMPMQIAFWDTRQGVAAGRIEARPCSGRCRAALAITRDGGRSWSVSRTMTGVFDSIQTLGAKEAWVRLEAPRAKSVFLFHSVDGGRSWSLTRSSDLVQNTQFVSSDQGFGTTYGDERAVGALMKTIDGGRTWQHLGNPCHQGAQIRSIWFLSTVRGWIWCISGRGTADSTIKELLATFDGGANWSTVRTTGLQLNGEPERTQFIDLSHGWSWNGLGYPERTEDGGRTWQIVHVPGFSVLDGEATGWAASRSMIFALNYRGGRIWLSKSDDAGRTWQVVRRWHDPF